MMTATAYTDRMMSHAASAARAEASSCARCTAHTAVSLSMDAILMASIIICAIIICSILLSLLAVSLLVVVLVLLAVLLIAEPSYTPKMRRRL